MSATPSGAGNIRPWFHPPDTPVGIDRMRSLSTEHHRTYDRRGTCMIEPMQQDPAEAVRPPSAAISLAAAARVAGHALAQSAVHVYCTVALTTDDDRNGL